MAAYGSVNGQVKHLGEIASEDQAKVFDRAYWQLPVYFKRASIEAMLHDQCFLQLPAINQPKKIVPINVYSIHQAGSLSDEISSIFDDHWWCFSSGEFDLTKNQYQFLFHLLREKWLGLWKIKDYKKLLSGKNTCVFCNMTVTPYKEFYRDFLELHELVKVDFMKEFIKIVPENFVVLCPNCHKHEHEKMKNEPDESRKKG